MLSTSDARLWLVADRADTAEPERRPLTPKRSDEVVRSVLSRLRRATTRPGLGTRIETARILRETRRSATRLFQLDLALPPDMPQPPYGMRAHVRLTFAPKPLAIRAGRALRTLFLDAFDV